MIQNVISKIQDELDFLKKLLENIGFSVVDIANSLEEAKNEAANYFLAEVATIYIKDDLVGECILLDLVNRNTIVIDITLDPFTIPKDVIDQLLLLGFKAENNNDWLEYEVAIKDGHNK